ncbi:hypothetical protein NMY22_g9025 [Coprinellus aureogranulatus]|nr:hypothetical protein NMY22_g9025 [Coprinellus aureogranulatus]
MSFPPFSDFSQLFYGVNPPSVPSTKSVQPPAPDDSIPRVNFGFSQEQVDDMRKGAGNLVKVIMDAGDVKDYFERLWIYWCNRYGMPRIGVIKEEDLQDVYYIRRARFWSVLKFYCRIPEGIVGTIVKKRLNEITVILGELKWEKYRQRYHHACECLRQRRIIVIGDKL